MFLTSIAKYGCDPEASGGTPAAHLQPITHRLEAAAPGPRLLDPGSPVGSPSDLLRVCLISIGLSPLLIAVSYLI